jgi:hypothetical protein
MSSPLIAYTEQNTNSSCGEANMPRKFLWRAVLIAVVSVALATPAPAESLDTAGKQIVAGIVVVAVAVGLLVTLLIVHYKHKKSTITGCVTAGANGMSVADEKDKRAYALSGDPVGIKPGERMTLEGRRKHAGQTLVFEAQSVTRDFGACQP